MLKWYKLFLKLRINNLEAKYEKKLTELDNKFKTLLQERSNGSN